MNFAGMLGVINFLSGIAERGRQAIRIDLRLIAGSLADFALAY